MATILIADDDPLLVKLITYKLEALGHAVLTAGDGETALEMVQTVHPDLVVLDGMMPGIDGLQVLQRLKKDAATNGIPVVMLTARRQEKDVISALSLGARDYLVKPFIPDELIARIKAILGSLSQ